MLGGSRKEKKGHRRGTRKTLEKDIRIKTEVQRRGNIEMKRRIEKEGQRRGTNIEMTRRKEKEGERRGTERH